MQPSNVAAAPSDDSINQFGAHIDDPAGYDGDGDHPLESEDEESDEEFIVMGRKKATKASKSSGAASNLGSATSNDPKRYLSGRRRSARTGSSGTVKKIGTTDHSEQESQPTGR
jgi:[calcium/calmodulin-dependent protein kinase] kinase